MATKRTEDERIRSAGGLFGPDFQRRLGDSPTLRDVYLRAWNHQQAPDTLGMLIALCEVLDSGAGDVGL